ncbi:MAG: riboflavin kinase [Alyxoria varia]|nr:MAG: riboflavin kinase [Alyxoria varia]
MGRDPIAGPDNGPVSPFPIKLKGRIIRGFGRGSKELGIPTANIPINGLDVGGHSDIESGVYFGWAGLNLATATDDASKARKPIGLKEEEEEGEGEEKHTAIPSSGSYSDREESSHPERHVATEVFPMVMSIGWNPYYKNTVRSVEVHILRKFHEDFYNALLNLTILGFIRREQDYDSLEMLVEDIKLDIEVARRSLEREAYLDLAKDPFLEDFE